MTYKATIKFEYNSEWTWNSEFLPQENVKMEFPSDDAATPQIFGAFRRFLLAAGYSSATINSGALSIAFNPDLVTAEEMEKSVEEYDLILVENHQKKVAQLEDEIVNLKAKLSRAQNPDNPNYTEEELDAMFLPHQHAEDYGRYVR